MDRTSLSRAWLEAPHKQIYDQGSSPQISVWNPRGSPRGLPLGFQTEIHFKPRASPQAELRPGRLPSSPGPDLATNQGAVRRAGLATNQGAVRRTGFATNQGMVRCTVVPHKQSYDQGGSPQAELRPGSLPTSRITTRELLAGWLAELVGCQHNWLGVWLAGLLRPRKAQRGPVRPRAAERG